jgi:hypothetical protein
MTRLASSALSLSLLFAGAAAFAPQASAQQEVGDSGTISAQQFMQALLPYGSWMAHPQFGWVWQPHDVQPWWQPFSVGEWMVTQDGSPYWRSGYPFGWATEHYGSWTFDESKGWLWIPGNDWSAAPVSWRVTDGVIGWAPAMATGSDVQAVACPQPAMAWIFVPMDRLMTASNFAVAEQELLARDAHGTWGHWAHEADGASAHRMPEPRNASLLDRTKCLGAADAKDAFLAAVKMRGGTTQGPPIEFVNSRGQMGSGHTQGGKIPAYAPKITGNPPPAGGDFLVNPPAERVQRALPAQRAQRIERAQPAERTQPALPVERAQPVQPAQRTPPAAPSTPLTPYEAYSYQHARLNEHQARQFERLREMHESDKSLTPAERERELREMQRMSARQRALLDARQREHSEAPSNQPQPAQP